MSRHPAEDATETGVYGHEYRPPDASRAYMAGHFDLSFSSNTVVLVSEAGRRSSRLPAWCAICEKIINDYPFVAKHGNYRIYRTVHRKRYHLACALSIGLVSLVPMEA